VGTSAGAVIMGRVSEGQINFAAENAVGKRLTENNSKVASTQLLLRPAATFDAQVRAPYYHP